MTRHKRKRWVGVCLLGAALGVTGCSLDITRPPAACCQPGTRGPCATAALQPDQRLTPLSATAARGLPGDKPADAAAQPAPAESGPTVVASITPVPAAVVNAPAVPESLPRPPAVEPVKPPEAARPYKVVKAPEPVPPCPVIQCAVTSCQAALGDQKLAVVPKPPRKKKRPAAESRPALALDPSAAPAAPTADARPAGFHPDGAAGHPEAARKGYIDLTVQPWFGCAEDHSWLNGQLMYSKATDSWRLHYASVDDPDAYGGTVTLVGTEELKGLKDGGYVKVYGSPTEPDRREPYSPYRVVSFEVVERPN
jgi:hypothetical protein